MKKTILTMAVLLGFSFGAFAQYGGGLFQYGAVSDEYDYGANARQDDGGLLGLPLLHGDDQDVDAPLGTGMAILMGLGGVYLLAKRKRGNSEI